MATSINPMPDYIVVQAEKAASKTKSGLYIPESAQEKPKTAKVIAVGSNVTSIKAGDLVIYRNEYETTTVKVGNEDFVVVSQNNIIATVK